MNQIIRLAPDTLDWLATGITVVPTDHAILRIEGPGAVECLQGLLTSDVARPGPGHLAYGALLTPKGMVIVDLWVFRDAEGFTVLAPSPARAATLEVLAKRMPPRLARVSELTESWASAWLLGDGTMAACRAAGIGWPESELQTVAVGGAVLGRPGSGGPAAGIMTGPAAAIQEMTDRLQTAGAVVGSSDHAEAIRILQGFPALGREIGEKTLPQEVRYDELGGVSYTKGCYVGQETVARVHFRGHPNRHLRSIVWRGEPVPPGTELHHGERAVGQVSSMLAVDGACLALGVVRREVDPGSEVLVGTTSARVVAPPAHGALLDLLR